MIISEHDIRLYYQLNEGTEVPLIIVNVDRSNDGTSLYEEIKSTTDKPFILAIIQVNSWSDELSPWPAEPVFGKHPFGGKGPNYLKQLEDHIIPELLKQLNCEISYIAVAGYSLAGLFALYTAYNSVRFEKIVSASGSLWYPGFKEYIFNTPLNKKINKIYLSLGDKEKISKNKLMAQVEENTLEIYDHLNKETDVYFEFNEGNHFKDPDKRLAKGIAYILNCD